MLVSWRQKEAWIMLGVRINIVHIEKEKVRLKLKKGWAKWLS